MSIVHKIESFLPTSWVDSWRLYKQYKKKQKQYARKIEQLRNVHRPIRVCFFALDASVWKYDSLYRLMAQDPLFEPMVLVCPIDNNGRENMLHKMEECYNFFLNKQYKVQRAYDKQRDTYIDAHDLHPDIIFYTNPYRYLIDDRYFIDKFTDALTGYVDYSFEITTEKWTYSLPIQQLVWRYYVPTQEHKHLYRWSNLPCILNNSCVAGYTPYDSFAEYVKKEHSLQGTKTIIWAPHHSIYPSQHEFDVRWSTFLLNADAMLHIAQSYPEIHFIFRPHPLLKVTLYKHPDWGKEKTDEYYRQWETLPNTEFSSGDYVAQFCESDALIHDCGSFLSEYLYTRKPCLYLSNYIEVYIRSNRLNKVGQAAWNAYYHAYTTDEIESFINDIVLNGNDTMESIRNNFYQTYLVPHDANLVADSICNDIKKAISAI